jgi:hypothetical protein
MSVLKLEDATMPENGQTNPLMLTYVLSKGIKTDSLLTSFICFWNQFIYYRQDLTRNTTSKKTNSIHKELD